MGLLHAVQSEEFQRSFNQWNTHGNKFAKFQEDYFKENERIIRGFYLGKNSCRDVLLNF